MLCLLSVLQNKRAHQINKTLCGDVCSLKVINKERPHENQIKCDCSGANKLDMRFKQKLEDHLARDDKINTKNTFTYTKRDKAVYFQ